MTEFDTKPDNAQFSPFQEKIALENFYAGANRGEILLEMTGALEDGVALMVLSGEEGSGKSMMCRMLEKETSRLYPSVMFPETVESFEDVVKIVAMRLGLKLDAGHEIKGVDGLLDRLTAHMVEEATQLLIIFDGAENIYLATLERIRKMLDRVTHAGGRMHIVFSGRKTFLENCDQLSICDFKNTTELHFELKPLSEQETEEYIRFCAAKLGDGEKTRLFNDGIISNIYSLAHGNFRMTNLLAKESLRTHHDDTSFMVLLESVKDEVDEDEEGVQQEVPHPVKRYAQYLPWVGGIACFVLLLFYLLKPADNKSELEQVQAPKEPAEVEVITQPSPPPQDKIAEEVVAVPPPFTKEGGQAPAGNTMELLSDSGTAVPGPVIAENRDESGGAAKTPLEISQQGHEPEGKQSAPIMTSLSEEPPVVAKVVELRQEKPLKRKPTVEAEGDKGSLKAKPGVEQPGGKAITSQLIVDQVFQKRLSAGSAWLKGAKDTDYTVQIMVLTAKNAEENLKKMLNQPNYRQEAGNFFIFKKAGGSETIFVFYGEYPSIAKARLTQNSLPSFLREHQPYAISIKAAMSKVKKK